MQNKKGGIHLGAVIAIIAILCATAVGAGYYMYQKNAKQVNVDTDSANVQVDEFDVGVGTDGAGIDMDGMIAQTSNDDTGVHINDSIEVAIGDESEVVISSQVDTVLIFDASGSMATQTEGGTRIDVAKSAMSDYVANLDGSANLSVVAYGHKGNSTPAGKVTSCAGIEEVYYMGPVNAAVVQARVNSLNPNGWTPITSSLQKAHDILMSSGGGGKKHIILLSDGEETCGGDPIAYAQELRSKGIIVDVIGLDVEGVAATQLNQISVSGGGVYYKVNGATDFNAAINSMGVKARIGNMNADISDDEVSLEMDGMNAVVNDDEVSLEMDELDLQIDDNGVSANISNSVNIPTF